MEAGQIHNTRSITECHMTAGQTDYIAKVFAKDFPHYETVIRNELSNLPHISSMETLFLFSNLSPNYIRVLPS